VTEGDEGGVDPVLERAPVTHEVEPEAGPLALGADLRVGQPDGRHELPVGELGKDPGIDLVGLGPQRRETLGPHRVGDLDVPAAALERVVHEAGAVHRPDRRLHGLAVPADPLDERPQGVRVGADRGDLHRLPSFIEVSHIEPLARQVQSGVQHVLGLLVLVALTTQRCHQRGPSS